MEGILLHVLYRGERLMTLHRRWSEAACAPRPRGRGLHAVRLLPASCEENCVLLVEHWRDRAALDKHSAGEPMAKLKALKASYDLATTVERFE